ncbi:hypothetical protein ADUPG1_010069, partial [Aduncisulcus paluster]
SRQPSFYSPGAPYPPSLTGGMAPSHPFSSYIIPSQSVAPSLGTGMYPPIPQPIQQPTYDPMGQAHRASVSSSQAFIYPQPQTFSQPPSQAPPMMGVPPQHPQGVVSYPSHSGLGRDGESSSIHGIRPIPSYGSVAQYPSMPGAPPTQFGW